MLVQLECGDKASQKVRASERVLKGRRVISHKGKGSSKPQELQDEKRNLNELEIFEQTNLIQLEEHAGFNSVPLNSSPSHHNPTHLIYTSASSN